MTTRTTPQHPDERAAKLAATRQLKMAESFHRYRTAHDSVKDFQQNTLSQAREAYDMYNDYFRKRRAAWPQVLVPTM